MKHSFIKTFLDPTPGEIKGFKPEEQEGLKIALAGIEATLGTKAATEVKTAVEKAMEPVTAELKGLKEFKVTAEEAAVKNQAALDKLIAEGKHIKFEAGSDQSSITKGLRDALAKNEKAMSDYKGEGGRAAISFELDTKTVGDIGANSNLSVSGTPAFRHGSALSEPGRKPYEIRHIRDLMRVVPLGKMQDTYVIRDNGGEGGPTSVALAAAKPESDRDWVKTIVPITKIAHHYKVPEEYLDDIDWMMDEITGVGIEELLAKEDSMFLTNSAGGEFLGLNQTFNSTAFDIATSSLYNAIANANNYDALVAAWTQLRVLKNQATAAIVHPYDYAMMVLAKASTAGLYHLGVNGTLPSVLGADIIPHTAITSDKYLIGDFSKVKVGVRKALSVRIYDQNSTDAIYNLVTIVIEERVTMAADRADRIIYGDFSVSKGQLDGSVASV